MFEVDKEYLDVVIKLAVQWNLKGVQDLLLRKDEILAAEISKTEGEYEIQQVYSQYCLLRRNKELGQSSDYLRVIILLHKYQEVFKNK